MTDASARAPLAAWALLWLYTAVLFRGAVLPPDAIPEILRNANDKAVHAAEYFFLFWFGVNAFGRSKQDMLRRQAAPAAAAYGAVVGALTEFAQFFAPGRSPELLDWVFDMLGAGVAWLLYLQARPRASESGA